MTAARVQHLRKIIDRADHAYYNTGKSLFSDDQYDALRKELLRLAPGDERNVRVGPPVLPPMLQKVQHACFMGSLNKCDTAAELHKWYADMLTRVPAEQTHRRSLLVALKADGASVALYYKEGKLWKAVTRGGDDGIGEDITANAINFMGVPTELPVPANIAVRGEVVLTTEHWLIIDKDQTSNPRNVGNGTMRRSDGANSDQLSFIAFDVEAMLYTYPDEIVTEVDKLTFLTTMGFDVIEHTVCASMTDAINWYDRVAERRSTLPIWIDGIVFKMNDLVLQRALGIHDNRPRAQTVLKFVAEGATTKLLDVVLTVGHTGAIIPTGKVEPVRIGGTTISSVLLNNFQMITDLDLAIGDTIRVVKAKDIIPMATEVLERPVGRQPIVAPTTCPVCAGPTGRRVVGKKGDSAGDEGAVTECKNDSCPAKAQARLKTWITKLDIQGIGDEVLTALITTQNVKTPADLYRLATDPVKVAFFPGLKVGAGKLGQKRAKSICDQILAKRSLPINVFMGSLGIPHLGRRRAELIMQAVPGKFETLGQWLDGKSLLTHAEAANVPNIAKEIAAGIEMFRTEIEDLCQFVTITDKSTSAAAPTSTDDAPTSAPLAGRTYCFTGKIEKVDEAGNRYTRARMEGLVVKHGGQVADDVRAGVTHLVQADANSISSKTTKAKKLGVQIESEANFFTSVGIA